jgi:hypothetical protein
MRVNHLSKPEFLKLVYEAPRESFLERIAAPEVFVVRQFYDPQEVLAYRRRVFATGLQSEASWHPLLDECPDYHRLHDNYVNAHVKAKMHAFYFHSWYQHNAALFGYFDEIFALKGHLAGVPPRRFLEQRPSAGPIARVNFQHYPVGGGYLAEHVDPVSPFAAVQTLVQASQWGSCFSHGGLYARDREGGEKTFLDPLTGPGDLLLLSPGIPHGVDPVDLDEAFDWQSDRGKWTVLPVIINGDYPRAGNVKPRQLVQAGRPGGFCGAAGE